LPDESSIFLPVENRPRWRDGRCAPVSHRCPPPLENALAFSTFLPCRRFFFFLPTNPTKGPLLLSLPTALVQAHPSMRKCCEGDGGQSIGEIEDKATPPRCSNSPSRQNAWESRSTTSRRSGSPTRLRHLCQGGCLAGSADSQSPRSYTVGSHPFLAQKHQKRIQYP
jgi:hypothetical protein